MTGTVDLIQKTFLAKAEDNPLEYIMSDATVDRMGDVIEPDGWKLSNFKKNPVAFFGHDTRFIVGGWKSVRVENGALRGQLELMDPVSDRLREIAGAVKAGILRAVSVGFRPVKSEPIEGSKRGGMRFLEQELVECSLVGVPANPNAVQVAKSLNLSTGTMSMIFGKHANEDRRIANVVDDCATLTTLEEWSPGLAREFKLWAAGLAKDYPFNPKYRKLYRLMEEIETVRTISLVSAEHGNKGRPA
jgi:HK97 family phage prohead protease